MDIFGTAAYQNKNNSIDKTIELNTCMAAAQYQLKGEPMALAVTNLYT
jgi:hypothetical protein